MGPSPRSVRSAQSSRTEALQGRRRSRRRRCQRHLVARPATSTSPSLGTATVLTSPSEASLLLYNPPLSYGPLAAGQNVYSALVTGAVPTSGGATQLTSNAFVLRQSVPPRTESRRGASGAVRSTLRVARRWSRSRLGQWHGSEADELPRSANRSRGCHSGGSSIRRRADGRRWTIPCNTGRRQPRLCSVGVD